MKRNSLTLLLAATMMMLAGLQTAKAQKVVLHMAGNQTAEYDALQLDSITFVDAANGGGSSIDPSVTGDAINITNKSATLTGYATSIRDNLANDLRVGFIYCLEGTPNKNNGTQVTVNKNDVAGDGRYTATIENLLSDATYYFRSFVYQSGLWFYGKVKSFVTAGIDVNFTTGNATDITCFSAKVSGGVDVQSTYSSLTYGICYGTSIEPTISDNTQSASSNSFTLQLRQLTGGTTYYYRPYAIVDGQTCYGTVHTFRTLDDNVVETGTIDEETLTVTSHLTIGGGAYNSLVLGVCYGTTEIPTINDYTATSDEVDDENNYTVQLVYWGFGTIYYRAYILIDGIPHYGAVKVFNGPTVNPKVRVGIYETINGYSVQNVKFYTGTTTIQNNCTLFAATGNETFNIDFGVLNSNTLSVTSSNPSFAGKAADNYYTSCPPNEEGSDLTIKCDYTLTSTDGSGEAINVKGATATIPAEYTKWEANKAYTYLFKITKDTNGKTDPYPITFDAVVVDFKNNKIGTETTFRIPSITVYQDGDVVTNGITYKAGDIVVIAMEGTADVTADCTWSYIEVAAADFDYTKNYNDQDGTWADGKLTTVVADKIYVIRATKTDAGDPADPTDDVTSTVFFVLVVGKNIPYWLN